MNRKFKVLIVDDSPVMSLAIKRLLNASLLGKAELSFEMASDGEQAIAILKDKTFDLLVSDVQMPKKSGFDLLLHQVDNVPSFSKSTFCVLMSSVNPEIYYTYAETLGAVFVPKDEPSQLVEKIKERFKIT